MTEDKTTITDNEVIARFMGWQIGLCYGQRGAFRSENDFVSGSSLDLFRTYWDWLMPVVEKIESLHDASYLVRIVSRRCIIYDSNIAKQEDVYMGSGEGIIASSINQESKLIACYKAVVQFIRWYNSTTQNKEQV